MILTNIKYYRFIIAVLFTTSLQITSFASDNPDFIYVHFDKSFYTSGETIQYKIYFLNKNQIESELVHVDIADVHDSVRISQILPVSNNTAYGSFILPVSFEEGNYLFKAYTAWSLNYNQKLIYTKVIPIFNEWDEDLTLDQNADIDSRDSLYQIPDNLKGLSLKILNQNQITVGDSVQVQIEIVGNRSANLSIAVTDLNLIEPSQTNLISDVSVPDNLVSNENLEVKYKPEKSFQIQGKVFDQITGEPITSRVLSVYNVREASFTRVISSNGDFFFELPIFEGSTDLQIINMNPYQDKVPLVIKQPLRTNSKNDMLIQELPERTPEINKYLFYSKLRRKLDEIFEEENPDALELTTTSVLPFVPDRSYEMDQYRLIKNLEDFVKEGVLKATSFKENGETKLKLFNIETKKYFMTTPWLMVDDHFVFNDSIVYNIPFSQLKRVDVFISSETIFKYFEPIMIQGGVLAIYTKDNFLVDYIRNSPNTLTISGIPAESNRNISNPSATISNEMPDFNPVIYWNPEIITDANGKATLSYPTNNVTGNCLIHIQGIDKNGRPIEGKVVYKVFP